MYVIYMCVINTSGAYTLIIPYIKVFLVPKLQILYIPSMHRMEFFDRFFFWISLKNFLKGFDRKVSRMFTNVTNVTQFKNPFYIYKKILYKKMKILWKKVGKQLIRRDITCDFLSIINL